MPSRRSTGSTARSSRTMPSIVRSPPVTAAADEAADLDVLGADRVHAAEQRLDARDVSTFEPIPSIFAPSETRKRQRSCTCGSLAALEIIVARRERRGHDGVLGRHHRRLVEVDVGARSADRSAHSARTRARRRAPRTHGCAGRAGGGRSRRRRAAGRWRDRGARAAGRRSGTRRGSGSRAPRRPRGPTSCAWTRTSLSPVHSTSAPRWRAARASCRRRGSAARSSASPAPG